MSLGLESKLLTPRGFENLKDMVDGLNYTMWDGKRFTSKTYNIVFQDDIKLFKVELNNGNVFYCDEEYIPRIKDIYDNLPSLNPIHGMFGAFQNGLYASQLHDEEDNVIVTYNKAIVDRLRCSYYLREDDGLYRVYITGGIKYNVPINRSMEAKMEWLNGFFAGGYEIVENDVVIDGNIKLLRNISLLLQTCGINPRLYKYKLYIPLNGLFRLGEFEYLYVDDFIDMEHKYELEIMSIKESEYDYTYQFE